MFVFKQLRHRFREVVFQASSSGYFNEKFLKV